MAGCEHELPLRDHGDHGFRLGQQCLSTRDADEGPVLLGKANLVFGVEGRHPDEAAPSTSDLRHVLDGGCVHAANREIEVDSTEHLEPGRCLAREKRQAGGRIVVILEHEAAHAVRVRELRRLDTVDRAWHVVRVGMDVDVDGATHDIRVRRRPGSLGKARCGDRGEGEQNGGQGPQGGRHRGLSILQTPRNQARRAVQTRKGTSRRRPTSKGRRASTTMAKQPDEQRLELLQGTLDMLILRTLQWGPQHGHGIGQAIRAQSDDLLKVETGSLYPALHRLVKRGWLKPEWGVSEANQRAKYYQLTAAGKAQLSRERDRWAQLVDAIGRVMNPAPASRE